MKMPASALAFALVALPYAAHAQTLTPGFAAQYTLTNLGSVTNIPTNYGCLLFQRDDPNTLLIGGSANQPAGALWSTAVIRDADNHIVGFSPATRFCDAPGNDGGIAYAPNGTLLIPEYSAGNMNQVKLGSAVVNRTIALSSIGISPSPGGTAIVPAGMPGAGRLKVTTYSGGKWYDVGFTLAADGTYDLGPATLEVTLNVSAEGYVFVPRCSPNFFAASILLCDYGQGKIVAYTVDEEGNPNIGSQREVVTGLSGAEGAVIDPVTGDFLFGTYGGGNRIVRVTGFAAPPRCPVDFNEDCFLDFMDFDLFVEAFESGDSKADFDKDGFLSFEDFDAFVTALERGGC